VTATPIEDQADPQLEIIYGLLDEMQIPRSEAAFTSLLRCTPPGKLNLKKDRKAAALECADAGLLQDIIDVNPKVIITFGNDVCSTLLDEKAGITTVNSQVRDLDEWKVVLSVSPRFILDGRDPDTALSMMRAAFRVAHDIVYGGTVKVERLYHHAQTLSEFKSMMKTISVVRDVPYVLDYENYPLKPWRDDAVVLSAAVTYKPQEAWGFLYKHPDAKWTVKELQYITHAWRDWCGSQLAKVAANIKHEIIWTREAFSVELCNVVGDAIVKDYLEDENRDHDVGTMAWRYTSDLGGYEHALDPYWFSTGKKKQPDYRKAPGTLLVKYNMIDVDVEATAYGILSRRLDATLTNVHDDILVPAAYTLASVEKTGWAVDASRAKKIKKAHAEQIKKDLEQLHTYEVFDRFERDQDAPFNFDSAPQKQRFFYGWDDKNKCKYEEPEKRYMDMEIEDDFLTDSGAPSTDKNWRAAHVQQYPIIDDYDKYLEHYTLMKSFLNPLPSYLDNKDKRVHTDYNAARVVSGRLSSTDPNCLHPDTMVDAVGGAKRACEVKTGDLLFSSQNGVPCITKVAWSGKQKGKASYRVTFDNGESVIASHDHRWPVLGVQQHGKRRTVVELLKRTCELSVGERMVPLYRDVEESSPYVRMHSYKNEYAAYRLEHDLVLSAKAGPKPAGHQAHHKNENKQDNSPDNLEWKQRSRHLSEHSKMTYANGRESRLRGLHEQLRDEPDKSPWRRAGKTTKCANPRCGRKFYARPSRNRKYCSRECFYSSGSFKLANHKVVAIERVGMQPMWDISCQQSNQVFALACGVCTHNTQNWPDDEEFWSIFVSRFPKGRFIKSDYSQVELRILAWLANDKTMIGTFKRHEDIHVNTARDFMEISLDRWLAMTDEERHEYRQMGKRFNFAVANNRGAHHLALDLTAWQRKAHPGENIVVTDEQAQEYLNRWYKPHKAILAWKRTEIENARERGYVESPFGYRRRAPLLHSSIKSERASAERTLISFLMQNTAAIITMKALNLIERTLREAEAETVLVGSCYDAIYADSPSDECDAAAELTNHLMMSIGKAARMPMELEVETAIGPNGGELMKLKYEEAA
jgi:DNA polymerase I-like protein with 3'-5' exonuclease and polymerase domains